MGDALYQDASLAGPGLGYTSQGDPFYAFKTKVDFTVPVYRYVNSQSKHFFCTDPASEILNGWKLEGNSAWYMYCASGSSVKPLNRYYNSEGNYHVYQLKAPTEAGFVFEKIQGYVYEAPQTGTMGVACWKRTY